MPNNIITSIFGGGGSSAAKGMRRSVGRGGNELIEEWPTRENNNIGRRRTTGPTKPPPPPASDVHVSSYTVPTLSPRRMTPKQHRYDGKKHVLDEESSCGTTADMVSRESFSSITDVSMDFSAFSLNDMPSVSCASVQSTGSRGSRHSAQTAPGINLAQDYRRKTHPDTPMRGRRPRSGTMQPRVSTSTIKKRVSFSDEAPSVHRYVPIAPNTHYNDDDDDYFREHTITLARGVLRILQTDAIHDDTFDTLTGLPSADIIKAYLNHPDLPAEEIVGIEDLLAGSGVASARKRLKKVQMRNLLSEQRRQSDMGIKDQKLLARSLRKTSSISANIARCRAAYAAALES